MVTATGTEGGRVRPIEHRLGEALRLPSLLVWGLATLVFLVLCAAWHNATGAWRGLEVDGQPFWWTPWRLEVVFAVILGYVLACGEWIVRSAQRDLDATAPVLELAPSELAAERVGLGLFSPLVLLAATLGGASVGIVVHSLVNALLPPGHSALDDRAWRLLRDVAIWVLSVRLVLVMIATSLRVSRLSERAARIDLLDLRGFAPLARIGLRSALAFTLAVSLIAAMSSDEVALPVTLATVAIVAAVGALTVPMPVRGVHRAIRAAKEGELLSVRAAIARARGAALAPGAEGVGGTQDAPRLGGLLALEARIAGVSEWPFDVGTFVRFALFLALPLGSWTAGALVERLVSRVLD
jgi:hypothetical protein